MSGVAVVDLAAYRRNLGVLSAAVAPATVMAVVKADAYGHGLLPVARVAVGAGIQTLGVLDAQTALSIRSDGIITPLFAWLFGSAETFTELIDADVDLGISHLHELERIASSGSPRRARLHLKIDTGLHRTGSSVADWPRFVGRAIDLHERGVVEVYGVWTHISESSAAEDSRAIGRFNRAIAVAESLGARFSVRHLAASAAGFSRPDARYDLVRFGAFCYGIAPGEGISPESLGLEPVLTLESSVIAVTGSQVRVGLGFGDGIPVSAAGRVSVAIGGERHPVVAVSAGWLEVAATVEVALGQTVTLFGSGMAGEATLQEWADALGTIGEELVTRLMPGMTRVYQNGS